MPPERPGRLRPLLHNKPFYGRAIVRMVIVAIAVGALIGLVLAGLSSSDQQLATFGPSTQGREQPNHSTVPAWTTVPYLLPSTAPTTQTSTLDIKGR